MTSRSFERTKILDSHVRTDPLCILRLNSVLDPLRNAAGESTGQCQCCEKRKDPELLITRSSSSSLLSQLGPAFTPAAARQNARAKNRKKDPSSSFQPHTVCLCVINNNQRENFPFLSSRIFFQKKKKKEKEESDG